MFAITFRDLVAGKHETIDIVRNGTRSEGKLYNLGGVAVHVVQQHHASNASSPPSKLQGRRVP